MQRFTDLLVQKRCFGCNFATDYFCSNCRKGFRPKNYRLPNGLLFRTLSQQNPAMMRAISGWKDRHLTSLTNCFADLLVDTEPALAANHEMQIVIPPQRKRAFATRGFYAMGQLAAELQRRNPNLKFDPDAVYYRREPRDQRGLSIKQRAENVEEVFAVNLKTDFPMLVLDDVWTTGSTLRQLILTLKNPEQVTNILVLATAYKISARDVWQSG